MLLLSAPPDKHTAFEDTLAFIVGTALVALSIQFLRSADLITGQVAGLSLLTSYVGGWSFGAVFFALNLPFYVFAVLRMGWRFMVKTFLAVGLLSLMAEGFGAWLTLDLPHPALAAFLAGITAGPGLLVLFRHGASLGGVGIMALYVQEKWGLKAGIIQLGFDALVFLAAFFVLEADVVIWSLMGAVLLNVVITMNHRRDRYVAS